MSQIHLSYKLDLAPESTWLTVNPTATAKSNLIYVQELGDFIAGPEYFTTRRNLPSYLIKYTLSGEGIMDYNGQTFYIRSSQALFIDCQNYQYYRTSPHTGNWRMVWVHFYGGSAKQYYDLFLSLNQGANSVTIYDQPNLPSSILFDLITLYRTEATSLITDVKASSMMTRLLSELICATTKSNSGAVIPACVQDARAYLGEHFGEHITLDDLSRRYNLNKYYFLKLFKRYTGFTPNEFLIQTRINKAKELLRTSSNSISQIAASVGVYNTSHFINLFRKSEGDTPSAYRRNWYNSQQPY